MAQKHVSVNGSWPFEAGDVDDNFTELYGITATTTSTLESTRSAMMPIPVISAPAADAIDISIMPTVVTAKGTASLLDYTQTATQVEIRLPSTTELIYESGDVAGLEVTVSPALVNATEYEIRARHKHSEGYYTLWSAWQSFTTVAGA